MLMLFVVTVLGMLALTAGLSGQSDTDAPKADAGKSAATISVVGLSVALHDGGRNELGSLARGMRAGTSVCFVGELGDRAVLEIVKSECWLRAFTDDTGKVLMKPGKCGRSGLFDGLSDTDVSEDRGQARFGFSTRKRPAENATAIKLKATMVFLAGLEEDTASSEKVMLEKGQSIGVGDYTFKITSVNNKPFGDAAMEIELESKKSFAAIIAIRFLDAAGKEVNVGTGGSGHRMGMGGRYTYMRTLRLSKALQTATVKINYYSKTKKVTVPMDVTVSVGL